MKEKVFLKEEKHLAAEENKISWRRKAHRKGKMIFRGGRKRKKRKEEQNPKP